MLHCIVLHCVELFSIVLYGIRSVQHGTVFYSPVYCTVLLFCIVLKLYILVLQLHSRMQMTSRSSSSSKHHMDAVVKVKEETLLHYKRKCKKKKNLLKGSQNLNNSEKLNIHKQSRFETQLYIYYK